MIQIKLQNWKEKRNKMRKLNVIKQLLAFTKIEMDKHEEDSRKNEIITCTPT